MIPSTSPPSRCSVGVRMISSSDASSAKCTRAPEGMSPSAPPRPASSSPPSPSFFPVRRGSSAHLFRPTDLRPHNNPPSPFVPSHVTNATVSFGRAPATSAPSPISANRARSRESSGWSKTASGVPSNSPPGANLILRHWSIVRWSAVRRGSGTSSSATSAASSATRAFASATRSSASTEGGSSSIAASSGASRSMHSTAYTTSTFDAFFFLLLDPSLRRGGRERGGARQAGRRRRRRETGFVRDALVLKVEGGIAEPGRRAAVVRGCAMTAREGSATLHARE